MSVGVCSQRPAQPACPHGTHSPTLTPPHATITLTFSHLTTTLTLSHVTTTCPHPPPAPPMPPESQPSSSSPEPRSGGAGASADPLPLAWPAPGPSACELLCGPAVPSRAFISRICLQGGRRALMLRDTREAGGHSCYVTSHVMVARREAGGHSCYVTPNHTPPGYIKYKIKHKPERPLKKMVIQRMKGYLPGYLPSRSGP